MKRILRHSIPCTASLLPLLLLVAACGGGTPEAKAPEAPAPAPTPPAAPAQPQAQGPSMDQLLVRELNGGLKPFKGKTPEGGSFAVDAAGDPQLAVKEDVLNVVIPIGTGESILCFVRKDSVPPSSLLYGMMEGLKKEFPKTALGKLDVAVAGEVPYIFAETQYIGQQDGKEVFGALKMAAFERNDDTLFCMHDEVGYRDSFRKVVEGLAKNLVLADEAKPETPTELEISIARIGTQRIGYEIGRHWARTDGTHDEMLSTALLTPASETELNALAVGQATASAKDGAVTTMRVASEQNGELAHALTVERTGNGKYHVEGVAKGQETKLDFTTKKPLWGAWREHNEIHDKMLGGPKTRELTFLEYQPTDDAANATTHVWKATTDASTFDTVQGTMNVRQSVDAQGRPTTGVAKIGNVELTLERVVILPATGLGPKTEPHKDPKAEAKKGEKKADEKKNDKAAPKKADKADPKKGK